MTARKHYIESGASFLASAFTGTAAYVQPEPGVASTLFVLSTLGLLWSGFERLDKASQVRREQRALTA